MESPRPTPAWRRVLAVVVVVLFGLVVVTTTVVSVGRYCLTSNGGDTRELPRGGDSRNEAARDSANGGD
jgi:hypothetical protein